MIPTTEGKGEEAGPGAVAEAAAGAEGDFEPVIAGPWMLRWKIGACVHTWVCAPSLPLSLSHPDCVSFLTLFGKQNTHSAPQPAHGPAGAAAGGGG